MVGEKLLLAGHVRLARHCHMNEGSKIGEGAIQVLHNVMVDVGMQTNQHYEGAQSNVISVTKE